MEIKFFSTIADFFFMNHVVIIYIILLGNILLTNTRVLNGYKRLVCHTLSTFLDSTCVLLHKIWLKCPLEWPWLLNFFPASDRKLGRNRSTRYIERDREDRRYHSPSTSRSAPQICHKEKVRIEIISQSFVLLIKNGVLYITYNN